MVGVGWCLLGGHAEEGTGGGWTSGCGVEGVVEVGDLGNVSVPVLIGHIHEEHNDEVDHIHLSAALTFHSPAGPAGLSIPGVRCCSDQSLAPSWYMGFFLHGRNR